MKHEPLSDVEETIGKAVVDAALRVHRGLGPGLLEKIYEACFCYELDQKGLDARRQVDIPIVYGEMSFDEGLRIDVLVEDCVICELKAVDRVNPVWQAQLLSQMKLAKKRLGFLINFNVPLIRDGIKRIFF
jgi:GxxExxY protein